MITTNLEYEVDLAKGFVQTKVKSILATYDDLATVFSVKVLRNGKEENLTGASCSASFKRSDDTTIPLVGSVSGNVASVTLSESCYRYAGKFEITIKLSLGGVKSTIFIGSGSVYLSETDAIIDDEDVIPSIADVIAQQQAAVAATNAANQAASKANSAASAANTAAGNANTAASSANSAVSAVNNATVTQVNTLDNTQNATASVAVQDGAWRFTFGLPRGLTGPAGGEGNTVPMTADELESKSASELAALYTDGARWLQVTNNNTVVCLSLKSDGSTEFQSTNMSRLNILDNPDFSNPVNQRNLTQQKTNWQYAIDRWLASIPSGNTGGIYISPGHISISEKCGVVQPIGNKSLFVGKNFTLVVRTISSTGVIDAYVASGTYNGDDSVISFFNSTIYIQVYSVSDDENLYAGIHNANASYSVWIYNAQLFEGSYSMKMLPPWEDPDLVFETLKCQYYAQILSTNSVNPLDLRPTMRLANPTITQLDTGKYLYSCEL